MIEWNTIIIALIIVVSNCLTFWIGSKLAIGENPIPRIPGKLEIIEPEEPEDKYGEIWPKDKVSYNEFGEITDAPEG